MNYCNIHLIDQIDDWHKNMLFVLKNLIFFYCCCCCSNQSIGCGRNQRKNKTKFFVDQWWNMHTNTRQADWIIKNEKKKERSIVICVIKDVIRCTDNSNTQIRIQEWKDSKKNLCMWVCENVWHKDNMIPRIFVHLNSNEWKKTNSMRVCVCDR